jgi:hypothetical protein
MDSPQWRGLSRVGGRIPSLGVAIPLMVCVLISILSFLK